MSPERQRDVLLSLWSLHFVHMGAQAGAWREHNNRSGGISPETLTNCSVAEFSTGSRGRASRTLEGLTHGGASRTGVCRG